MQLEMDPEFLEIEPKRGMIMAEERKVIKMRCKSEYLSSIGGLERKSHALLVRASYFSEYNKKIMVSRVRLRPRMGSEAGVSFQGSSRKSNSPFTSTSPKKSRESRQIPAILH